MIIGSRIWNDLRDPDGTQIRPKSDQIRPKSSGMIRCDPDGPKALPTAAGIRCDVLASPCFAFFGCEHIGRGVLQYPPEH